MRSTVTPRRESATASASAGNRCPPVPPAATMTRGGLLRSSISAHSRPLPPYPGTAGVPPSPPCPPRQAGEGYQKCPPPLAGEGRVGEELAGRPRSQGRAVAAATGPYADDRG